MGSYFSRVIGGALVVAATLVHVGSADAYEVKRTRSGARVHWDEREVEVGVHASLRSHEGGAEAAASAFAAWSGRVGAPTMKTTDRAPDAPGLDGENGVFFMKDGYEPAGRALAITILTYDSKTGAIVDADVVVNGRYDLSVLPHDARAPRGATALGGSTTAAALRGRERYDLLHVLAHESGHTLGMDDEDDQPSALMYRYSAPNDTSVREPGADDIAGLSEVYGASLSAEGAACEGRISPRAPTGGATRWGAALALAAITFALLRGRGRARDAATACVFLLAIGLPAPVAAARATSARVDAPTARVTRVDTRRVGALLQSVIEVERDDCGRTSCAPVRLVEWGGEQGGLTMDVGGRYVPRAWDRVGLATASAPLATQHPLAARHGAPVVRALRR